MQQAQLRQQLEALAVGDEALRHWVVQVLHLVARLSAEARQAPHASQAVPDAPRALRRRQ